MQPLVEGGVATSPSPRAATWPVGGAAAATAAAPLSRRTVHLQDFGAIAAGYTEWVLDRPLTVGLFQAFVDELAPQLGGRPGAKVASQCACWAVQQCCSSAARPCFNSSDTVLGCPCAWQRCCAYCSALLSLTFVLPFCGRPQILDVASAAGEPAFTLARALPQARRCLLRQPACMHSCRLGRVRCA